MVRYASIKLAFLVHGDAGEAVVGRIAEDDEDRHLALHPLGGVALLLQLGEQQACFGPWGGSQPVRALVR